MADKPDSVNTNPPPAGSSRSGGTPPGGSGRTGGANTPPGKVIGTGERATSSIATNSHVHLARTRRDPSDGALLHALAQLIRDVEVCEIDCEHLTMFKEPALLRVASELRKKLAASRPHDGQGVTNLPRADEPANPNGSLGQMRKSL